MIERRIKVLLAVTSLVGAGVVAALAPAAAQGTGGGTGGFTTGAEKNNTVSNLLIPMAAIAYGAYWLATGLRYHQITVPHRVGHPYYIAPKPTAREESDTTRGSAEGEGEQKDDR